MRDLKSGMLVLEGLGDTVHIVDDVKGINSRLRGAGIPTPALTKEMQALALLNVRDGYKVKKVVPICPLGPYYHLDARWSPTKSSSSSAKPLKYWDPQWSVWYTSEWWQQLSTRPDGLPIFDEGSPVHLIPLEEATARAASCGYDISGLGLYVPPLSAVGELRTIESVDYDFDSNGRVTYVFHIGHSSHVQILRLITSFFFREFWDAFVQRVPIPTIEDDEGGMVIEN